MIELAFYNPTYNVGFNEYNRMRELNLNEIKAVNGGYWQRLALGLVTLAMNTNWGSASYDDMMVAP